MSKKLSRNSNNCARSFQRILKATEFYFNKLYFLYKVIVRIENITKLKCFILIFFHLPRLVMKLQEECVWEGDYV